MSRELHGALRRVEEFEAVRSEEKEEWQDRQKSTTAAENEEEMIEVQLPMLCFNTPHTRKVVCVA